MLNFKMQAETRHTEKIKQHTKMCYYYVCIGAEVVIIVLLLIVLYAV